MNIFKQPYSGLRVWWAFPLLISLASLKPSKSLGPQSGKKLCEQKIKEILVCAYFGAAVCYFDFIPPNSCNRKRQKKKPFPTYLPLCNIYDFNRQPWSHSSVILPAWRVLDYLVTFCMEAIQYFWSPSVALLCIFCLFFLTFFYFFRWG